MSFENEKGPLVIKEVQGVIAKKSTWTPSADFCKDTPSYKEFQWIELDSFTLMSEDKKEHKFFEKSGVIGLNFWDFGTLKVTFTKKNK